MTLSSFPNFEIKKKDQGHQKKMKRPSENEHRIVKSTKKEGENLTEMD